jgi:hypothetical protein
MVTNVTFSIVIGIAVSVESVTVVTVVTSN